MATIDNQDCCLVCADPMEWTAVGACGHSEVCSKCVARMRFVLKVRVAASQEISHVGAPHT